MLNWYVILFLIYPWSNLWGMAVDDRPWCWYIIMYMTARDWMYADEAVVSLFRTLPCYSGECRLV